MTDFDSVKDSGERRSFGTGSVRDIRTGKGRYDLLPPIAIKRLAQHFENGAVKYGDKNWELGQPLSGYLDSGLRHTFNLLELKVDEDHAAAGIWNLIAFLCTAEWIIEGRLPRDLDDIGFCDALEEAREDAELENLIDIGHAPHVFTGGGPADGPIEAPMVVDYVGGIPDTGEQTTVLSREGAPETDDEPEVPRAAEYGEGWTVVETSPSSWFAYPPDDNGVPVAAQPLGEGWQDLGYLTEDAAFQPPSWVPKTVEFEISPLRQETLDLLTGARFQAGPPAETVDNNVTPLARLLQGLFDRRP